jgi:hypothetical protein
VHALKDKGGRVGVRRVSDAAVTAQGVPCRPPFVPCPAQRRRMSLTPSAAPPATLTCASATAAAAAAAAAAVVLGGLGGQQDKALALEETAYVYGPALRRGLQVRLRSRCTCRVHCDDDSVTRMAVTRIHSRRP